MKSCLSDHLSWCGICAETKYRFLINRIFLFLKMIFSIYVSTTCNLTFKKTTHYRLNQLWMIYFVNIDIQTTDGGKVLYNVKINKETFLSFSSGLVVLP